MDCVEPGDECDGSGIYDCDLNCFYSPYWLGDGYCDEMLSCEALDWDGGDCGGGGGGDGCESLGFSEDIDLGTSIGSPVSIGSTSGASNTLSGSCGGSGASDKIFRFEAPYSGAFTFSTEGSSYDTVLYIIDACSGDELACNDDGGSGTTSSLSGSFTAGSTVYIVVDGYSSSSGSFDLNISAW
jgi:hypothetical protein